MKYLVAIMLPEEVAEPIRQLQQQYKTNRWHIRVAPHITLMHRGDLIVPKQELLDTLQLVASDFTPFPVTVQGIGTFVRKSNVIFAKVPPNKKLLDLQRTLFTLVESLFTSDTKFSGKKEFHPHITLANRLTTQEMEDRLQQLHQQQITFEFLCQSFTLLQLEPRQERWQSIADFSLRTS